MYWVLMPILAAVLTTAYIAAKAYYSVGLKLFEYLYLRARGNKPFKVIMFLFMFCGVSFL